MRCAYTSGPANGLGFFPGDLAVHSIDILSFASLAAPSVFGIEVERFVVDEVLLVFTEPLPFEGVEGSLYSSSLPPLPERSSSSASIFNLLRFRAPPLVSSSACTGEISGSSLLRTLGLIGDLVAGLRSTDYSSMVPERPGSAEVDMRTLRAWLRTLS